jgi:tRNA A-37 threonylcarbamoyl transferase component Bud32
MAVAEARSPARKFDLMRDGLAGYPLEDDNQPKNWAAKKPSFKASYIGESGAMSPVRVTNSNIQFSTTKLTEPTDKKAGVGGLFKLHTQESTPTGIHHDFFPALPKLDKNSSSSRSSKHIQPLTAAHMSKFLDSYNPSVYGSPEDRPEAQARSLNIQLDARDSQPALRELRDREQDPSSRKLLPSESLREFKSQKEYLGYRSGFNNQIYQARNFIEKTSDSSLPPRNLNGLHSGTNLEVASKQLKEMILAKDAALSTGILTQQKNQHSLNRSIRNKKSLISNRDSTLTFEKSPDYFRQQNTASTGLISSGGLYGVAQEETQSGLRSNKHSIDINMNDFLASKPRLPSVNKNTFFKIPSKRSNWEYTESNDTEDKDDVISPAKRSSNRESGQPKEATLALPEMASKGGSKKEQAVLKPQISFRVDWSSSATDRLDLTAEFKLDKVLGKGNSSTVHRAYDLRLNRTVAVKILEKSSIKESYLRDMLQKEIDVSLTFDHPNLAKLLRVLQDSVRVYLVQEYCGTQTLSQYTEQRRLSDNKIKHIFKQIVQGVYYMHAKGFAHRDLKFSNILINEYGAVKLVDFGFVCEALKKQRIFCGTPSYMPPELVKKKDYLAGPVDQWCMGVILFKLATNSYPFGACNDKNLDKNIESCRYSIPQNINSEIRRLIDSLIKYSPKDRLQAEDLARDVWLASNQK